MKFETARIYLVKWRRVCCLIQKFCYYGNVTWDFSSLLAKKPTTLQVRSTLFVHFFDVVLHDYNVKLPSSFYVGKCGMCSPMFRRVPIHFFFLQCRSFSPCWPPFLIFSPPFPCFSSNEICLCFLSNALALLSMSLETLKFSRTWLCCWFFSLLSPDGLSLSKKSRWTLGFPPKNPVLHLPYLLIELVYIGMPVVRKGVRTLTWLFMHSEPKFLPMVYRCARESFAKNVCGEPRRQKTPK